MKILYDHQIFEYQKFGGISRYFFELLKGLNSNNIKFELPIIYSDNEYLSKISPFNEKLKKRPNQNDEFKSFLFGFNFKGKTKLYNLIRKSGFASEPLNFTEHNRELVIEKLKEGNFDVFHPTYYDPYFLDYIGNKPYVVTVYDLIHEIFPEYGLYNCTIKNHIVFEKAAKIIAISHSTKVDLINIFGISENKIEVIYLGNSLDPAVNQNNLDKSIPKKYLLFVGKRGEYKNFYFFIRVYSLFIKEFNDLEVICTGEPFTEEETKYFELLRINEKLHHLYVDDVQLAHLYKNAYAFVFPSIYEGFGLPILEAFSCGCPVLASNSSSLKEIGEGAILYFDSKNAESMLNALRKIYTDPYLKKELIKRGFLQLQKFTWENTVSDTLKLYSRLI